MLSTFIPIGAITFWFIVFSRGEIEENLKTHETIHYKQYNETLVLGFFLLYFWDWLVGLWKYRDARKAYERIRFEQEAYAHASDPGYPTRRRRWAWRRFKV